MKKVEEQLVVSIKSTNSIHDLQEEALKLPNKTHPDSPIGNESKNRVVRTGGVKKQSKVVKSHLEIGEEFDLLDFQNASKVTGNKFVYLKNEAALMELALVNWALNFVHKKGYIPITTPDIAKSTAVAACGF